MGIGVSLFLLAVGAILTFAFNYRLGWLDLDAVGWILMGAGALGLILTISILSSRRRTVVSSVTPPPGERRITEERTPIDEREL